MSVFQVKVSCQITVTGFKSKKYVRSNIPAVSGLAPAARLDPPGKLSVRRRGPLAVRVPVGVQPVRDRLARGRGKPRRDGVDKPAGLWQRGGGGGRPRLCRRRAAGHDRARRLGRREPRARGELADGQRHERDRGRERNRLPRLRAIGWCVRDTGCIRSVRTRVAGLGCIPSRWMPDGKRGACLARVALEPGPAGGGRVGPVGARAPAGAVARLQRAVRGGPGRLRDRRGFRRQLLRVYNVRTPVLPQLVGTFVSWATALQVAGNHAFVAAFSGSGFRTLSLW